MMMQTTDMAKELIFKLRIDAEEKARLDSVAAYHGVSSAALFRLLLKKEERAIAASAPGHMSIADSMHGRTGVFTEMADHVRGKSKAKRSKR